MLSYPLRLIPEGNGRVRLTVPDVPEATLLAATEEEAIAAAAAKLETVLATYVVAGRPIPTPSDTCGAPTVCTARFSLLGVE